MRGAASGPVRTGPARTGRTLVLMAAALMLGACSEAGQSLDAALAGKSSSEKPPGSPLDEAAKKAAENPKDADAALAHADLLKQHGRKEEALSVLHNASQMHGGNRKILSAYGRLALDAGKLSLARGLLEAADDPTNPDWRVLSARGTVLAKEGRHNESIAFFERARPLSADHASVVNNLALAYMMSGDPAKAEPLLRQAAVAEPANVRVRQNLALVLSLQGRFDEAKSLAAQDLSPDAAAANAELMRKIVRIEQKPAARTATAAAESTWDTNVEDPKPRRASVAAPAKAKAKATAAAPAPTLRGSALETSSTN
jgi:Flp pilus assembly protein TadD